MKEILKVKRGDGSYSEVAIGNVIDTLDSYLPTGKKIIVITDENVYGIYNTIIDRYEKIIIGLGESNKTISTLEFIYDKLLEMGADRGSYIVGFGGGIVTDIVGFAASTYMRGLGFGFVATTLLAQVDASVGGKNGVNFEGFKNMIGVFNQPDFVLCDITVLSTLPEREFCSGLAEIIKSGLILDEELFELFVDNSYEDFRNNEDLIFEAVRRAVKVKKTIVELDERETGDRKKLNLGHTFAHAIEKCSREFVHGEAVGIGLRIIADISVREGLLSSDECRRINSVLDNAGLPKESGVPMEALLEALKNDKKKESDMVSLILMKGIGECIIKKYDLEEIKHLVA
ncbi:MAG: 3-dehydroquinate synthase [Rikenellaceae bacterium]|nr:3-dehydroquinate synthase [Rikenellaceae bacterium]